MTKTYDIIRFYSTGQRKRLIMANVPEDKAREWCDSPKTKKAGKWFDGLTPSHSNIYKCQLGRALYPSNYDLSDLK